MNVQMNASVGDGYTNQSQKARRVTEGWAGTNLFCVACDCNHVITSANNTQAIDFICPQCDASYQLKAGKRWNERRIPDAGYDAMVTALRSDRIPNLLVMQYSQNWCVENLMLVPSFFFSLAAVEKRQPLGPLARRAGWVGCNILLHAISENGKIRLITDRCIHKPQTIRNQYKLVQPLSQLDVSVRGWTLDVLRVLQELRSPTFTLDAVYGFEQKLSKLHPDNRYIREKIRQQLQVLRDLQFVHFLGAGRYQLREVHQQL
jgi:type II restriction enzyme